MSILNPTTVTVTSESKGSPVPALIPLAELYRLKMRAVDTAVNELMAMRTAPNLRSAMLHLQAAQSYRAVVEVYTQMIAERSLCEAHTWSWQCEISDTCKAPF